ncbi:MAG: hypothetical protein LBL83_10905, partial [Clostridiales bacterium]|nr:hypothetical protein [Clostridiales bacterium]
HIFRHRIRATQPRPGKAQTAPLPLRAFPPCASARLLPQQMLQAHRANIQQPNFSPNFANGPALSRLSD